MTAAHSAAQQSRNPSAASRPAAAPRSPARATRAFGFDDNDGDEIRINLADIPRMSLAVESSMHVEGLKPTLLSRLAGLFMR